ANQSSDIDGQTERARAWATLESVRREGRGDLRAVRSTFPKAGRWTAIRLAEITPNSIIGAHLNPTTTDPEQPLRGVLDEFRIALREEISAAQKTSSSNAVPLTNGRRISQIGGTFQYAFTVDSILNVPGDAPGDLMVAGQR